MRDYEQYGIDYLDEDNAFEHFALKARRHIVLESIVRNGSFSILEIGCGAESIFQFLRNKRGVIIEPSMKLLKLAEKKIHDSNDVIVHNSMFETTKMDIREFDYILISGVLHEVDNIDLFFSKLIAASNGSVIHINVPNGNSLHRHVGVRMGLLTDKLDFSPFNKRYQIQSVFDMNKLRLLIKRYSFKEITSGYYGFKPFTHLQMNNLMKSEAFGMEVVKALYSAADLAPDLSAEMYIEIMTDN